MFVLCKHAAILMDAKVLSRLPYEKWQGCRRGKEGGWGRLSDHFALLNLSILLRFSHPDSRLIFPSPFTLGVVMHVITKLAAVGGYRGILMPETLPWWHPALHLSISIFYCHCSTAVLLSHYCNHYTIICSLDPIYVRAMTSCHLSSPLLHSDIAS